MRRISGERRAKRAARERRMELMTVLKGSVVRGCGHFTHRMSNFPEPFRSAIGETLFPGTLNVDVGRPIGIKEDF